MQIFMAVAVGALFLVWILTGVKLMMLAHRTRALPELLLGAALLLVAGVGYPLAVAAEYAGDHHTLLIAASSLCTSTGTALLFVFTARVFRPQSSVAWAGVGAGAAFLAVQAIGNVLAQAAAPTLEARIHATLTWGAATLALSGAAWGWAGLEALRHHALLRKRVPLGLADPVVANRMLLFGLMGGAAFVCVVVDSVLLYLGGEHARLVLLPLVTAATGLLISVFMVLAFWPPAAYLKLLRVEPPSAAA